MPLLLLQHYDLYLIHNSTKPHHGAFLRLQVLCYIVAIFLGFITMEKEARSEKANKPDLMLTRPNPAPPPRTTIIGSEEARPEYKPVPPIIETPPIKYISGEDERNLGSDRNIAAINIMIAFCIGLLIGLFLCK